MSKYEPFFSLQRPLFDSDGGRGFVYASDQLKNAADAFRSAFSKPSPLLCVGGQLGCGKSSTINYALDQLDEKTLRISIGRVRLTEDEVIDLLLEKLSIDDASGGTIRKLGRFAKKVEALRDGGERVVIIVEDAVRTGANIVAELDVLCGGDGGADVALIVCGDEALRRLLKTPELEPVSQRMSDFVRLAPFAVDELEDYLRHAVSEAGGDYDSIFGKDYAGLTHILSCGVPRIANKLTEASLDAAAKAGTKRVSCALLADVAKTRFDIETELPVHRKAPEAPKQVKVAPAPTAPKPPAPENTPKPVQSTAPPDAAADPAARQIPDITALTGSRAPSPQDAPRERDELDIPHLIQDTQPELKALTPDLSVGNGPEETDSSGSFVSLPNLEDLTAEFAAVSQMIESLPTGRYDMDENSSEIDAAFSDFGALDKALEPELKIAPEPKAPVPTAPAPKAPAPEKTLPIDATSTALPKLSIPGDSTLNEAPSVQIDEIEVSPPKPAAPKAPSTKAVPKPQAAKPSLPEMPVLKVETPKDDVVVEPPVLEKKTPETPSKPVQNDVAHTATATPPPAEPSAAFELETDEQVDASHETPAAQETAPTESDIEVAEVKDWDRDPTLAELKPDLDALELAMGEDIQLSSEPEQSPVPDPTPAPKDKPPVVVKPAAMPEITLDTSIKAKVEEAVTENVKATDEKPEGSGGPSDTEVHRMMEDLSKASSLEDMDDRLAETLFGDEINLVASQVLKAARQSMDDKNAETPAELSLEQTAENPIPAKPQANSTDESTSPVPAEFAEEEGEVIDLKSMRPNAGLDMSASQRLRTVRALNAGMGTPPSAPTASKPKAPAPPKEKPVPIEDQMDLSMTATFKALKIDPNALQQEADDETEKKGFFSRFRKKG